MYCLTLRNNDLDFIKKLDFIPVGLGKNISSKLVVDGKMITSNVVSQNKPLPKSCVIITVPEPWSPQAIEILESVAESHTISPLTTDHT